MNAIELAHLLDLAPHPEGGYFRETYRSEETLARGALPGRFAGDRVFGTSIYFLLTEGTFSALHTIESDELWHHYDGGALRIVTLDEHGAREDFVLGKDYARGERPFAWVPRGRVFGSHVEPGVPHALVGCTVAPGFDFADFRMPSRHELLARYPEHEAVVTRLTRSSP